MKKGLFAVTTACTLLLCGCVSIEKTISNSFESITNIIFTTPQIPVSQLKPARELSAKRMKRIAVIHDQRKPLAGSILETNLTNIKLNNSPYFTLVERSQIDSIIKEQKLNDGMLTNSATRIKLGKLTGADTLINAGYSAKVDSSRYSEKRSKCVQKGDNWYKCKKTQSYSVSCTKKTAVVILDPKAVSVESGQIIFSNHYSEIAESKVCNDSNDAQRTDEELVGSALARVADELKSDLAPFTLTTKVDLMDGDSSDMPNDAEKMFDMGIEFVQEGMYENACQMFSKAQTKYSSSIAITYNNAVCAEFLADVEMADAFYSKATTMTDDIDELKLVMEGETRIKQRLIDTQILNELVTERL
ncbi:CsgG/HfaB family protein [Shewanella sp. A14]